MTNCTREIISFPALNRRNCEAEFSGGDITIDGGVLLLRQMDKQLGLMESINPILHETAAILEQVRQSGLLTSALNLTITEKWDFAINQEYRFDTFTVGNSVLSASEFGNYVAGYAGAYHGGDPGVYGALLGGAYFDFALNGPSWPLDKFDVPGIISGAIQGNCDRNGGN